MKKRRNTTRKALEEQRHNLRYFQMMVRMDYHSYLKSVAKCKEIGARMRQLQKEEKHEGKTQ